MRRAFFVLALVPLLALPATNAAVSIHTINLAGAQRVMDAMLSVPQIDAALRGGDIVVIALGPVVFSGARIGNQVPLTEGAPVGTPKVTFTMGTDAALSLLNAYNRPNTAKLVLRGGFVGIDGDRQVIAGVRFIRSGSLDDQLNARPPAAGDAISYQGSKGNLRSQGDHFLVRLGDNDYMVDSLGGVIANVGPSAFHNPPDGSGIILDPDSGASYGLQPLDEGCVADEGSYLLWGFNLSACEWQVLAETPGVV